MNGSLCLHAGANVIQPAVLRDVVTPEATATWTPVPHDTLVNSVRSALTYNGATIVREEHALYHDGDRYFGLLHLGDDKDGGNTVIGIRNSHDKTFPAGLSLGNRVFVCDNLAFSSDVTVARKHTTFIRRDLDRLIYAAVGKLADMRVKQTARLAAYENRELGDVDAHDIIIRLCWPASSAARACQRSSRNGVSRATKSSNPVPCGPCSTASPKSSRE